MLVFLSRFRWIVVVVLILIVVAVELVAQVTDPAASITVSKETTYITEPLADDGLPDFEKYLLEKGFEGVTPENNAAVLLWRAFWPEGVPPEYRDAMREALGLDAATLNESGLVLLCDELLFEQVSTWLCNHHQAGTEIEINVQKLTDFEREVIAMEVIQSAIDRPWTSSQVPPLADWIEENRTQLGWIKEASRRSHLFSPPPNFLAGKSVGLANARVPMVRNLQYGCRALSVEAMWHLGERRPLEAWESSFACFQLAVRISHSFSLAHNLVAIAIEGLACYQAPMILHQSTFKSSEARQILHHFVALPPLQPMGVALNKERLNFIDVALSFATGRKEVTGNLVPSIGPAGGDVNWDLVLRSLNGYFDRLVEATGISDRQERYETVKRWSQQLIDSCEREGEGGSEKSIDIDETEKSQLVTAELLRSVAIVAETILQTEDRALTLRELTKVAAALTVYRAEHGEYPESLEQLVPDILPEMPIDLYSGEPFIYRPMDDGGYLLYSVYENGIDNGGTGLGGEIVDGEWALERVDVNREECDLVFRVPVPEFELPRLPETDD